MKRSPAKGRAPRLTLADLAPAQRIDCIRCEQTKPAAGATKFRARDVCAECTAALRALSTSMPKEAKRP
ncbi:hypothetical protein [Acidovorax sp. SUPP2539]|uniref:hypothetical protein n=1 Tax=Acidovorax sp. SUPP2539 TaxID=2920878 RepID=UPI0023DE5AD2|nr:hypothetical protein [Acidovorax sp. SUPP2539]GKS91184.1 hypothetical protein AVTE2539_17485 [Acidovorax sp. SUPP2539]